jgi:hypothetical protein
MYTFLGNCSHFLKASYQAYTGNRVCCKAGSGGGPCSDQQKAHDDDQPVTGHARSSGTLSI